MNLEEECYWRGYVDAKVESLGKTRTHHPSPEQQREYRDRLLAEKGLTLSE